MIAECCLPKRLQVLYLSKDAYLQEPWHKVSLLEDSCGERVCLGGGHGSGGIELGGHHDNE